MKTRTWIILLAVLLALCSVLSFFILFTGEASLTAQVYSDGVLIKTVSLLEDQTFTVPASNGGSNTVEVRDGKIAVTQATCPDHHCIYRGFRNHGPAIICLPNALELRFSPNSQVDIPLG